MPLFCVIGAVPTPPVFSPVTLRDVREKQCRWIEQDLCCGAETARGRVYCPEHYRRAYAKAKRPISVPAGI